MSEKKIWLWQIERGNKRQKQCYVEVWVAGYCPIGFKDYDFDIILKDKEYYATAPISGYIKDKCLVVSKKSWEECRREKFFLAKAQM